MLFITVLYQINVDVLRTIELKTKNFFKKFINSATKKIFFHDSDAGYNDLWQRYYSSIVYSIVLVYITIKDNYYFMLWLVGFIVNIIRCSKKKNN